MRLGIDVGGTHTDAVLIDQDIVAVAKVSTDHADLLSSIHAVLLEVLKDTHPNRVKTLSLSTTLCTNAIVQDRIEAVAMLVSGGPGIDCRNHSIGPHFTMIDGAIDHRGIELKALDQAALDSAAAHLLDSGVRSFGVVGKFSTRNPNHELRMRDALARAEIVTLGHQLSGALNLPRRIATAYYNSAASRLYNQFLDAMIQGLKDAGITAAINVVKADGGAIPQTLSRTLPVQSIFSGPAASVMGIMALCHIDQDSLILDIGGTTTDMAVFVNGVPLLEPDGISIGNRPTLVRALKMRSIGIGGDSTVRWTQSGLSLGPDRQGPPLALGGPLPALTDALNTLGMASFGNIEASIQGFTQLGQFQGVGPMEAAKAVVQLATAGIRQAAKVFLSEINAEPVYTLHELLKGRSVAFSRVVVMGGPAKALADSLEREFHLPVTCPKHFAVANAVGAALTKNTLAVNLHADTPRGQMFIPNLGLVKNIPSSYTLEEATAEAKQTLFDHLTKLGLSADMADIEVVRASSFNMVDQFSTLGRNIRVRCQTKPGVVRHLNFC